MLRFCKQSVLLFFVFLFCISCQNEKVCQKNLKDMSLREKIGQLFIVRPDALSSNMTLEQINSTTEYGITEISDLFKQKYQKYPVGGFCLFDKNIQSQHQIRSFTKQLKKLGNVILSIDEEGGRVARLANNVKFDLPKYESMQAIAQNDNTNDVFVAAQTIGAYVRKFGFDLNFAPVADVNSNPNNIIIGNRSFGNQSNIVSEMVISYYKGLLSVGVAGCLKHFPGHGDTTADTHNGYVETLKTWEQLLECEIIPFQQAINAGADMIMIAHISTPNVTNNKLPATLSSYICQNILREQLGFKGVIITDAMSMGAIHNQYSSAESAVKAFLAGCDIILMPYDLQEAFDAIENAIKSGEISESRLDESVNRILLFKSKFYNK